MRRPEPKELLPMGLEGDLVDLPFRPAPVVAWARCGKCGMVHPDNYLHELEAGVCVACREARLVKGASVAVLWGRRESWAARTARELGDLVRLAWERVKDRVGG